MKLRRKELIEHYAPSCVSEHVRVGKFMRTKKSAEHALWVGRDQYRDFLQKGYEPVEKDGGVIEDEGDVLMKCPQKLFEESLRGPALEAAFRLRQPSDTKKNGAGAVDEQTSEQSLEDARVSAGDGT
jgi:hypothetical protein